MYNAPEDYLSTLLIENNLVTESQIEDARGQRKGTESLVETIVRTGQVKESEMAQCYAIANGMEYLSLTNIPAPDKTVIDLVDLDVARRNSVVPIGVNEAGQIQVVVGDPFDLAAIDNLNHLVGHDVEAQHSSSFEEINDAIGRWYDEAIGAASADDELVVLSESSGGDTGGDGEAAANDAPVIKLVNQILTESFNAGASDIHVEPLENSVRVRYRIDGVLHEVANHPRNLLSAIIARFKIMTGAMSIAEKRLPQDARIQLRLGDKDLEQIMDVFLENNRQDNFLKALTKIKEDSDSIRKIASLTKPIIELAQKGNNTALAIVQEASHYVANYILSTIEELNYINDNLILAGNGSVIRNEYFRNSVNDELKFHFKDIKWTFSTISPAYGAAIMASRLFANLEISIKDIIAGDALFAT